MTIKVNIEPNDTDDRNYVLRVRDGANNNLLVSSTSQGYENVGFVQDLARRLFPPLRDQIVGEFDGHGNAIEPVVMVTHYRSGDQKTEQLR